MKTYSSNCVNLFQLHSSCSLIFFIVMLLFSSCALESPKFEVIDNCVIVKRRTWIQSLSITTTDPSTYYHIRRNYQLDGSHKFCLDAIPQGYWIIRHKDTLDINAIRFPEGDTVEIDQSGGDRASFHQRYRVENGKLVLIEKMIYWGFISRFSFVFSF